MKKPFLIAAIICFALFALTLKYGWGATYYMLADGTNADPDCSETSACCAGSMDMTDFNAASFSGDDIVYMCDDSGTYRATMIVPSSGSVGQPITIAAYTGDTPVISGADLVGDIWSETEGESNVWETTSTISTEATGLFYDGSFGNVQTALVDVDSEGDWWWDSDIIYFYSTSDPYTAYTSPGVEIAQRNYAIYAIGDKYITIDGITVQHTVHNGILFGQACDGVVIQNSVAQWCGRGGIGVVAWGGTASTTGTIKNNITHDNAKYHSDGVGGITFFFSASGDVSENVTYNNGDNQYADHGIYGGGTNKAVVAKHNLSYSNAAAGLKASSLTTGVTYSGNVTYSNGYAGVHVDHGASGIDIYNHTDYASVNGLFLSAEEADAATIDTVKNCIFLNNTEYGVKIYEDGANGIITTFTNNDVTGGVTGDFNIGTGTINGSGDDPTGSNGNIDSDPLLTDVANDLFTLTGASPAIGAGVDVSLTTDYNGAPVCDPPSIGAYDVCTDITAGSATITLGTGGSATLR